MAVQDDAREAELIELFELHEGQGGRSGTDAALFLEGVRVPFELKSTTKGSVTTVRDFGPDHIDKWLGKHWLIGFYDSRGVELKYSLYATPEMMAPWIEAKAKYVGPDFALAKHARAGVTIDALFEILGDKEIYSLNDAKRVQKRQYSADRYRELVDVAGGYSQARMIEILEDRLEYLVKRGATLNNPHIPASYFKGWKPISTDHAAELRRRVASYLASRASETDSATR